MLKHKTLTHMEDNFKGFVTFAYIIVATFAVCIINFYYGAWQAGVSLLIVTIISLFWGRIVNKLSELTFNK